MMLSAALVSRLPKGARIALVPEGPYTFARPAPVLRLNSLNRSS